MIRRKENRKKRWAVDRKTEETLGERWKRMQSGIQRARRMKGMK
jgi:flagellar biosynthesis/type III secretory pathway chaperone